MQILADGLTGDAADELEGEWIRQEGSTLVNWVSHGRQFDYVARCAA